MITRNVVLESMQDLAGLESDSSPVFWDLDLDLWPMDLHLTHPDLNFDFFQGIFTFGLMENPDSQSEIVSHLLWESIRVDPIGSSLFSKPLWCWINLTVYQCYYVSNQ